MAREDRTKEKQMAYVLHQEFGYTKKSISSLMKISAQQMGTWIKETGYQVQIHKLENELDSSRKILKELKYEPQKVLEAKIIEKL